jgi:hypothetical protein
LRNQFWGPNNILSMYREFWILEGEATSRSPWPKTIGSLSFGWKSGTQPPPKVFFSLFPADDEGPSSRGEPLFLLIPSYKVREGGFSIFLLPHSRGQGPTAPQSLFLPRWTPSPFDHHFPFFSAQNLPTVISHSRLFSPAKRPPTVPFPPIFFPSAASTSSSPSL